jgi:hypothetical protein
VSDSDDHQFISVEAGGMVGDERLELPTSSV